MDLQVNRYRHAELGKNRMVLLDDDDTLCSLAHVMSETFNDQIFLQRMEVLFLIKDKFSGLHVHG